MRRYRLPPLDMLLGFEAATRTLSFTKAADELALTQSAVSRQIRTLEDSLGIELFTRRHRALELTEAGRSLQRATVDILDQLQRTVDSFSPAMAPPQVSITTTTGFAALWLIPRLKRFTSAHPNVDVRLAATDTALDLERQSIDIAVRYTSPRNAPEGAVPLFGEEILPVCSRALIEQGPHPLRVPADLVHHTLIQMDFGANSRAWYDWDTWLTAFGVPDLKPASSIHLSQYDQVINAAIAGQGVALGRLPLIGALIASGQLVAPFETSVVGTRGYVVVVTPSGQRNPDVVAFRDWLLQEAKPQPSPNGASVERASRTVSRRGSGLKPSRRP